MSDDDRTPLRRRRAPADAPAQALAPGTPPDLVAVGAAVDAPDPTVTRPPLIEAPSPDVAVVPAASRLPGAPRDGYHQLPTAPVVTAVSTPDEGESVPWEPPTVSPVRRAGRWAPAALTVAVLALVASLFVGWMLPLAVVAIVLALVALRRRSGSRAVAVWALVLGSAAVLYSAGWLVWALTRSL